MLLKDSHLTTLAGILTLIAVPFLFGCTKRDVAATELFVEASQNRQSLPLYDVFELTLRHNGVYANKFFGPAVETAFIAPSGKQTRIKGFYYGADLWKVRFRANEVGPWHYQYTLAGSNGFIRRGAGQFEATPSDAPGPVVRNPNNNYRWNFGNGMPFFPLGIEMCVGAKGSQLEGTIVDGGTRSEGGRKVSMDEYFALFGAAGFNLFRFSQQNCSFSLFDDLDHYREAEAQATDELLATARAHGFRIIFGIFGSYGPTSSNRIVRAIASRLHLAREAAIALRDPDTAKEKRFIDYCIARWGVYADFWELLNEREASDDWTAAIAEYVHANDPDQKPVSTSWEKPLLPAIDINAPHWYESEQEVKSDVRVQEQAAKWKQFAKPVMVGEQGNSGMNWEPNSGVRMRIRSWTALFEEIALVFWETSWSKQGMHQGRYTPGGASNIYIGPEERGYMHALSEFAAQLKPDVEMASVQVNSPEVRAYGLRSKDGAAVYLVHASDHKSVANNVVITVPLLQSGTKWVGRWIDPASGAELNRQEIPPTGRVEAPAFHADLALVVLPH